MFEHISFEFYFYITKMETKIISFTKDNSYGIDMSF
ncbi:unnamed protein product, partial [Vitis vinifera]